MLNFIPIPHAIMNEVFCEPTKHNSLQDMIHVYIAHISQGHVKNLPIVTK
jgi:hypothetical protein